MFATMTTTILMMAVTMFGNVYVEGLSKRGWDFLATYNGVYDNSRRVNEGFTKHDKGYITVKQVDVPCLSPNQVIMTELDRNGRVLFRDLLVVSDGEDNIVILTPYNFTGGNVSSPGHFDTSLLLNLTKADLSTDPSCVVEFEDIGPENFFGDWPICDVTIDGKHPSWSLEFTCDHVIASVPLFVNESRDNAPYDMRRIGSKFSLINPPPGFVNPCDQTVQ